MAYNPKISEPHTATTLNNVEKIVFHSQQKSKSKNQNSIEYASSSNATDYPHDQQSKIEGYEHNELEPKVRATKNIKKNPRISKESTSKKLVYSEILAECQRQGIRDISPPGKRQPKKTIKFGSAVPKNHSSKKPFWLKLK